MSRLTQKGQVTIPRTVRRVLEVHSGDEVEFIITEQGKVEVVRKSQKAPFDAFVGCLRSSKLKNSDKIVAGLRGRRA